jgi:GTP-binding protein EngB required for normal cell division
MIEYGPLDDRLARLREAVDAARAIGLEEEAAEARAVARRVGRRAGFGGAVYVMALAGGTGVGKSSILNALAGSEVSEVRALRPTTDRPLAWVAEERASEVADLLEWLKVERIVAHADRTLEDVAVLDLPDVDSVRREHRALVDMLLPRIDAVTWIVDPEKYDDARVHEYWRALAPHADRLRFILNKADLLSEEDRDVVAEDLRRRLVADGIPRPVISIVSATTGLGIDRLRADLADVAHAKVIVAAKLEADRAAAAEALAASVGLAPDAGYRPLLAPPRREEAVEATARGALDLIDPVGVGRQVRSAVLAKARTGGGSFLARVVGLLGTLTGSRRRGGDPGRYLGAWRERGALGRVLNPLRATLVEAVRGVPPESRGRVLDAMGVPEAERLLERTLDEVARREGREVEIPTSPLWPVIGLAQIVVGAVLLFAIAWVVTLFVAGGGVPVATAEVPILGPIPMPLALAAAALIVSGLLAWALGAHAAWIGRRVAARIAASTVTAVREAIGRDGFAGLDAVEEARRTIAATIEGP